MYAHEFEIDDEIPFPIGEGKSIQLHLTMKGEADFDFDGDTWVIDRCEIQTDEYSETEKKWLTDWVRIDDLPEHKNIMAAALRYINLNINPYEIYEIKRPKAQELYA